MYEFTTAAFGLVFLMFFVQEAETSAQVVLTADPQRSNVMSGKTVRLTCKVEDSDPFTQWEYTWKKLSETEETELSSYTGEGFSNYTLSHVTESDSAQYWCEAKTENQDIISSPHNLTVTPLQYPVLTLNPAWRKFYPTEKVTLKCEIQSPQAEWSYLWYRDGAAINSALSREDEYTIPALDQSHSGRYSCSGGIPGRAVYTEMSKDVTLTVDARPQAVLTLETAWTEIFRSDSLTLRCQVEGSSAEWNYTWYRDGRHLPLDPSGDRLTLTAGNDSYSSEYKCRGNRTGQPSYTEISEGFRANNIVSCIVENLARIAVGAAILLFLSVIVNEGFWRRARKMRRCCI